MVVISKGSRTQGVVYYFLEICEGRGHIRTRHDGLWRTKRRERRHDRDRARVRNSVMHHFRHSRSWQWHYHAAPSSEGVTNDKTTVFIEIMVNLSLNILQRLLQTNGVQPRRRPGAKPNSQNLTLANNAT